MALSNPTQNFSVHSIAPYALQDKTIAGVEFKKGVPFGMFQVLGDASFNLNASSIQNYGGSSLYAWASEITQIDAEATLTVKESPDMLFSLFGGANITKTAASATGSIVAIQNVNGVSLVAATGLASATIETGKEADLGLNVYVVKAVGPDSVDVYAMTDMQFTNGDDLDFIDDELKITVSPLTIVASTAVSVPNSGVELTGGAGTIALVTGDTAVYKTVAAHGGFSTIDIGQKGVVFPEFGMFLYGKPRADGTLLEIELFKCQSSAGMVLPMTEGDFQISDLTVKALLNNQPLDGSGVAKLATLRSVRPA